MQTVLQDQECVLRTIIFVSRNYQLLIHARIILMAVINYTFNFDYVPWLIKLPKTLTARYKHQINHDISRYSRTVIHFVSESDHLPVNKSYSFYGF